MGYWGIRSLLQELLMPWTDKQRGQQNSGDSKEYSGHSTRDKPHGDISGENQSPYGREGSLLFLLRMARFSDSLTGGRGVVEKQDVVPLQCIFTTQVRGPSTSKGTYRQCLTSVRGLSKGGILTYIFTVKVEWYPLSSRIMSGSYGSVFNSAALEEVPTRNNTMLVITAVVQI